MLTVDDRCTMGSCPGKGIYRMVGKCGNCGQEDILSLHTAGHEARRVTCPVCGCDTVDPTRLATPDEIPVA